MEYKLAFLGFGNVGKALAQLLLRKEAEIKQRYDISFTVTGIASGSHGSAINPAGIDLHRRCSKPRIMRVSRHIRLMEMLSILSAAVGRMCYLKTHR